MDKNTRQLLSLLDEYGRRLHSLLTKMTLCEDAAADCLQELFLRLRDADGFRKSKQPERYMFRAAINLAFDWRRQQRRIHTSDEHLDDTASCCLTPDDQIAEREEAERILQAMERLSEDDRELLTMKFIHGESHAEIADRFESTPHRVRALCSKAVARLRRLVGEQAASEPMEVPHARRP